MLKSFFKVWGFFLTDLVNNLYGEFNIHFKERAAFNVHFITKLCLLNGSLCN